MDASGKRNTAGGALRSSRSRGLFFIAVPAWLSWSLGIMRTILSVLTLSLLVCGCQKQGRPPLVIEDATPIVGAGRTAEDFGIETLGGVFTPLIKSGTTVPCSHSEIFSTASDGQSQIIVTPFRGANHLVAGNHALGRFQVVGIPSAPRGTPQIQITFTITDGQILISARDFARRTDLEVQRIAGDTKL